MGNAITKFFNDFECKSECAIHHELDDKIDDIDFLNLNLKQKDIQILNKIISKRKCKYKNITEL